MVIGNRLIIIMPIELLGFIYTIKNAGIQLPCTLF